MIGGGYTHMTAEHIEMADIGGSSLLSSLNL